MLSNHRKVPKAPGGDLAPGPPSQVEELELELGQGTVACSAQVVGKPSSLSPLLSRTEVEVWGPCQQHTIPRYSDYYPPCCSQHWGWTGKERDECSEEVISGHRCDLIFQWFLQMWRALNFAWDCRLYFPSR